MAASRRRHTNDPILRAAQALASELMPGLATEVARVLRRLEPDLTLRPRPLDRTAAERQRRCRARKRAASLVHQAGVAGAILSFGG